MICKNKNTKYSHKGFKATECVNCIFGSSF